MPRKPRPTKQALAKATTQTDVVIAVNLRRLLALRGMSRKQLAARLSLSDTTVDKWCNAKCRLSAARLWQLSRMLPCPVQDFFDPVEGHA